jgi:FemAB family protein
LYTDLTASLADIRAAIRKSYRPLISSGLKLWRVAVMDTASLQQEVWAEFRELHKTVSGRVTRSDDSWRCQLAMIADGGAFLVYLQDAASGRMVGAGFFQFTRDEGLYAVAAYDRTLFDEPLGHVVQYRAIEELKGRGLRWYRIGERHYPRDHPEPTQKQLAIASFKQGFASHMFCRYLFAHSARRFASP